MKKRNNATSQDENDNKLLNIVASADSIQTDFKTILNDYKSISINNETSTENESFSTERLSLLRNLQRLVVLVDLLEKKFPDLHTELGSNAPFWDGVNYARNEFFKWSSSHINENDSIDVFDKEYNSWFEAKVLAVQRTPNNSLRVHYLGWHKSFDAIINVFESNFFIAPANTFTKKRFTPSKKKKSTDNETEVDIQDSEQSMHDNSQIHYNDDSAVNDNDKEISEKANSGGDAQTSDGKIATEVDGNSNSSMYHSTRRKGRQQPTTSATESTKKAKKDKTKDKEKDNNEWVCSICEFLESPDDSDLLLCDGPCLRSFHIGCLHGRNLSSEPSEDEVWLCLDCTEGKHICFICGEKGDDYKDVFNCSLNVCGKYYHLKCLEDGDELQFQNIQAMREVEVVVRVASKSEGGEEQSWEADDDSTLLVRKETPTHIRWLQKKTMSVPTLRCPYHYCDTCYSFYRSNDSSLRELSQCSFCPRAFHSICLPPGTRYNQYCVICPRHPYEIMPSKEVKARKLLRTEAKGSSYGTSAVKIKEEVANTESSPAEGSNSAELMSKLLINFWDQLVVPEEVPNLANPLDYHFKLQLHIKESVENTPPQWKTIAKNDYDSLPKDRVPPVHEHDICCDCTDFCGDRCMNRILRFECSSGKGRQPQTCKVGALCSNRALQNKRYAEVEVFREPNMGWGLKTKDFVASGTLVIEYVGEIIDFAEVTRRMGAQCSERPNDKDFYIMELDTDLYVDGKHKGNNSRYINHSCDPNCELQRWVVGGTMRIGIFAVRDIEKGESLSYDYQFDTNEADTFRCHCGTEACRGTMAPKKKNAQKIDRAILLQLADGSGSSSGIGQLSKADREQLILAGKLQEKRLSTKGMIADEWGRSYTGKLIPGEAINEIKSGPVKSSLNLGRHYGSFLVRNVRKGQNMLGRHEKLTVREQQKGVNTTVVAALAESSVVV